ncbi:Mov34/MPN/PAD-1 family protein [Cohnella sp. GCM10020058]|uniref:Mov34/MPN/PAD-1 family protein n=1 Tax=Cohnella sp. GCM10020058 TaxID=3317330 RepID=UPI00363461CB
MHLPKEVQISKSLLQALTEGCRLTLPFEACGALLGAYHEAVFVISDFLFIQNAAVNPANAFAFEPGSWIRAAYAAQKSRQQIIGFFHSHPSSPPLPSDSDLRGWDGFGCYLIVGIQPSTDIRVFGLNDDGAWTRLKLYVL